MIRLWVDGGVLTHWQEKGRRWSPYNYALNNPMRFIDPDGMWPLPSWNDIKHYVKTVIGWDFIQPELQAYSKKHPINASVAFSMGKIGEDINNRLGNNSLMNGATTKRGAEHDGGIRNAIKHTFVATALSSRLGISTAQEMGNLNEKMQDEGPLRQMDLSNNSVGVEIGSTLSILSPTSEMLSKVLDVGLQGRLTIVTYDENGKEITNKVNLSDKKYEKQVNKIREVINQIK